ncbi:MAG: alpha/beta hydrolase [Candidatus Dormibacteraeota bacterium]|nr:alpha/beta hydrolase [Candidatus Dormibacteraeota bacterium]
MSTVLRTVESPVDLVMEPHTQAWLDTLAAGGGPPLYELSPTEAREVLRSVQTSVPVDLMPADVEEHVIAGGPSGDVSIRIVKPKNAPGELPVVLHMHGGGWILGDKDTHERLDREVANAAQAAVVFVNYTPAPDAHYPLQIEQAYAALKWVATSGRQIGADSRRIALLGDSVGGNMSAALTLLAKERGGPDIRAQVLFYPVTDAAFDTGSYEQYADGPWLTREAMKWFWDAYIPDQTRRSESTASPLRASLDELRGLPPALLINGQHDVLRDEGEAYGRRLTQAGVPVTQVRYSGTIHDFVLLNPIANTPAPRAAIAQAAAYLRQALST